MVYHLINTSQHVADTEAVDWRHTVSVHVVILLGGAVEAEN